MVGSSVGLKTQEQNTNQPSVGTEIYEQTGKVPSIKSYPTLPCYFSLII
jgi:hypothetical protein